MVFFTPLGQFHFPGEFTEFTGPIEHIEICETTEAPSRILSQLKRSETLLMIGDYRYADAIYRYCQHYDKKLIDPEEITQSDPVRRQAAKKLLIRQRLHHLLFAAREDSLLFMENACCSAGMRRWLNEDMGAQPYLIPIRRFGRILTDMKREKEGIWFDFLKQSLLIQPFVYVPSDQSVPAMFLNYSHLLKGKRVLDVGTGTGILAVLAAENGAAEVTATDISENAVQCARKNADRLCLQSKITVCDPGPMFEPVKNSLFDVVLFNAPWIKGEPKSPYDRALYDPDCCTVNQFLGEVTKHLEPSGCVLLQYSDVSQRSGEESMTNLYAMLAKNGLTILGQTSIIRKSRYLGSPERIFVFQIVRGEESSS